MGNQTVAATAAGVDGSPANFSATADAPIVLHYDGTSWATALEDVSGANTSLASIWGGTGSELFAVGSFCGGNLLLRHSGTSWDLPQACAGNPGPFDVSMSVWGSSASDVFAVHRDSYPPSIRTTILHYDGQQWNPIYERECSFLSSGSSCNDFLDAVWSTSSADAFAVGGAGTIKHFDGTGWSPQASGTTNELHAVWGAAPGAVFAVGDAGSIVFYDGSAWVSQTSGTNQPLNAVSGISANDVFAVGAGGTILHYDGSSWTAQTSGTTQTLRGVWGTSANAVFAVGDGSTILRYDGTKWAAQTTTADMNLRGIWGSSATNVFAVGAPR